MNLRVFFSRNLAVVGIVAYALLLGDSLCVAAQTSEEMVEAGTNEDITLEFLDPKNQSEPSVQGLVVGFVGVLDAATFPTILLFRSNGQDICTAVLVGPRALLTAAHCLETRSYSIKVKETRIPLKCYHSPVYSLPVEHSNDWALCHLQRDLPADTVMKFERLDVTNRPKPGDIVMLTGYGCTVEDGPTSSQLLYGYARVIERPEFVAREDTAFWTKASWEDPETGSSLCARDSGGPAIATGTGGPSDNPRIVGVNSRVRYQEKISWFSATASKTGLKFFDAWVKTLDSPICGLNYRGEIYDVNCRK